MNTGIVGVQRPRVLSVPAGSSELSQLAVEAVELCRTAGLVLDDWQAFVLGHALSQRTDGKWFAFEVGVDVARQNGKGGILEARELTGLFLLPDDRLQIHSAHQFDTSVEAFRRLEFLIQDTPELHAQVKAKGGYKHSHGEEGIELKNGKRIRFRTRTKGGGRGFTCDTLYLDEAMYIQEAMHGALLPTLSARPNPQVWYTGSAVDQDVHEYGVVFARVRERGHQGKDPSLAYFEWSADCDKLEDVGLELLDDRSAWAQANPGLGIRIALEHVSYERHGMGAREFAVERLGIGDWPRTDGRRQTMIPIEAWGELTDVKSEMVDPVCFAFDVTPDRSRACIAAAGRRADGLLHLEVVDLRKGTGWVSARLAELEARHECAGVVCDSIGPAASLVRDIEEQGVSVETVTGSEYARACGRIVDAVAEQRVRHLGTPELAAAIEGADTRPLGDAWAWSRRRSTGVNITPLVAGTLALSAAERAIVGEPVFDWDAVAA